MSLTPKKRAALFLMFNGVCAYCGRPLPKKGWHADHVEPVQRDWWKALRSSTTPRMVEGELVMVAQDRTVTMSRPDLDHIGNMMPSCRACNLDKGAITVEQWRKSLSGRPGVCRRNHSAFRHAERFGLVVEVIKPVVFYFEQVALAGAESEKEEQER